MAGRVGNKFSLSGVISLGDKFSKPLKKAGRLYSRFSRNIRDENHMIGRSFRRVNSSLNKGLKRTAMVGFASLSIGLGLAAREFVTFDQAIVSASAKFKDLEIGTKNYADTQDLLRKKAREVGDQTHFTAKQAAEGLNFYAKAGFKSAEAMAVLADTVDLATVAEMDLNRTADISSDLLASLGLNASDTATKIKNLAFLNRSLGLSVNMANVNLEDMFETLKLAGPIAADIGATTNEIIAMTAALGGAGIKGSLASTALRNIYGRLIKPVGAIQDRLDQLNLSQKDFLRADGSLDVLKAMDKIGKATEKLTKVERAAVFFDLFGLRAVAGASNLQKSLGGVQDIIKKLESDATLKKIADEMRTGLLMQLQTLGSAALEKAFQFFDAFTANGKDGIKKLTEAIRALDVKPLIQFTKTVISVLGFIADNWKILLSLAVGIKAVSAAIAIAEIAVGLFGITLGLTPIGGALIALGLLATAITLLVSHYDDLDKAASRANDAVAGTSGGTKTSTGQIPFTPMFGGGFNPFTYKKSRAIEQEPQIYNEGFKAGITPKPVSYSNYDYTSGQLDINFNGLPQGADVQKSGNFGGSKINIQPALQP